MADIKHKRIIVNKFKRYQSKKIDVVKTIITSINKEFKVENITIGDISFDFDIEISQNDNFEFLNDIAMYKPSESSSALEALNETIWLYLFQKKDFNEKLEQFKHFIQMVEAHKEFVFLYPAYHKIHIEILDGIICSSTCQENNFEEFQTQFYSQYGIDLKEYLDKKPICEEAILDDSADGELTHEKRILDDPAAEEPNEIQASNKKRAPQTIYNEYQIYVNKHKMLRNITHLDNTNNKEIVFNLNSSKPIHKLIKSYSSYIEINPLMTRQEIQELVNQYYRICSEVTELVKLFDKESESSEYDNPTYSLKSNTPNSKSGKLLIKSSMMIVMIMEHHQIDHIEMAIRYFNYYWVKKNYRSIQLENKPLLSILNDKQCNHLTGTISLQKDKNFYLIEHGKTKRSIIKLIKLLKQSL